MEGILLLGGIRLLETLLAKMPSRVTNLDGQSVRVSG